MIHSRLVVYQGVKGLVTKTVFEADGRKVFKKGYRSGLELFQAIVRNIKLDPYYSFPSILSKLPDFVDVI